MTVKSLVDHLGLLPHPEGGYYKETYKSEMMVDVPDGRGERSFSTGIYFLIEEKNFSAFHRIKSDEMWHYYSGCPLRVVEITEDGELTETKIGADFSKGEVPQYVVKKGRWFASYCDQEDGYSLVGCTVSPGFDFQDFEMAKREELVSQFPQHETLITKLTRV